MHNDLYAGRRYVIETRPTTLFDKGAKRLAGYDKRAKTMNYLLSDLSEEEKRKLEEQFFSDDAEFEELEIAEDELIDLYVRNELSDDDRRRFEQTLQSSPRLNERLSFARLLVNKTTKTPSPEISLRTPAKSNNSFWNWVLGNSPSGSLAGRLIPLTALGLILIAAIVSVAGWLSLRNTNRKLTAERAQVETEKSNLEQQVQAQKLQTAQLASELQAEIDQRQAQDKLIEELQAKIKVSDSSIAVLALLSGTVRGGGNGNRLVIGSGTSQVRLTIYVGRVEYNKYTVHISSPEGRVVYTKSGLRPHDKSAKATVTVQIAAGLLSRGDYIVKVEGLTSTGGSESVADYSFHVETR
jgi:anti-sigma factor RsiW